jgi:hypothetical protein
MRTRSHSFCCTKRARIASQAGRVGEYHASRGEAERWARKTGTPALIAKCERLAELDRPEDTARGRRPPASSLSAESSEWTEDEDTDVGQPTARRQRRRAVTSSIPPAN